MTAEPLNVPLRDDDPSDPTRASRRALLKYATAAGMTAWVAPRILDVSVAGAATSYSVQFTGGGTRETTTNSPTGACGATAAPNLPKPANYCNPTPWTAGVGTSPPPTVTYSLVAGQPRFTLSDANCKILEAKAELFCPNASGGANCSCVPGTINGSGSQATFPSPGLCLYVAFRLRIECSS